MHDDKPGVRESEPRQDWRGPYHLACCETTPGAPLRSTKIDEDVPHASKVHGSTAPCPHDGVSVAAKNDHRDKAFASVRKQQVSELLDVPRNDLPEPDGRLRDPDDQDMNGLFVAEGDVQAVDQIDQNPEYIVWTGRDGLTKVRKGL